MTTIADTVETQILCVEDTPEHAKTIQEKLEKLPARIAVARTGDEAFDLLLKASRPYNIVILDMRVPPGIDSDPKLNWGLDVLIQQQKYYNLLPAETPVVVFTQHATFANCVACMKAGAYDYIPKVDPITGESNLGHLFAVCQELLKKTEDSEVDWLTTHEAELAKASGRPYVALVSERSARNAGLEGPIVADRMLIEGDSIEAVRRKLLEYPALRRERPTVVRVRSGARL